MDVMKFYICKVNLQSLPLRLFSSEFNVKFLTCPVSGAFTACPHSYRSESAGLATAALKAKNRVVTMAMRRDNTPAKRKYCSPRGMR